MRISIVSFDGFNEIDTFLLLSILNQMRGDGWKADIVCAGPKITSVGSVVVASQRPLEWANDSDVVLFGSSTRMREIADDSKTLGRLQLEPERQLIGAQCNGSLLLQALGVLPTAEVCAEQPALAWLIQAGLKPVVAPLRAHGNVATAGGRLAATYLAAWVIWRLDSDAAARHALYRVAPAGEEERFIAHALNVVRPYVTGEAAEVEPAYAEEVAVPAEPIVVPASVAAPEPAEEYEEEIVVPPTRTAPVAPLRPVPTAMPGFDGRGEPAYCGIVQAVGKVGTVQPLLGGVLRVMVVSERFGLADVAVGDGVSVNGYSAKVVAKTERSFKFDLSPDVVASTTGLESPGNEVNLEKPMRPGTRVGGHVLAGQVDTVGEVLKFVQAGESWQLVVQVAQAFAPCLAVKGSVAINGVSLTTNQVKDMKDRCIFSVNLIPHTLEVTALKTLQPGHKVNVEVDMFARQLQAMLTDVELPGMSKSRKAR